MNLKRILIVLQFSTIIFVLNAQNESHDVLHLGGSVYLLRPDHPKFGNPSTIISVGVDGVFLVDPGPMDLIEELLLTIEGLDGKEIKYITTTHHHGDHSEGLAYFAEEKGTMAPISQINLLSKARVFLSGEPLKKEQLPKIGFNSQIEISMNNEEIEITTLPNRKGHTGGDILVYFKNAEVLAVGDYVFLEDIPIVDIYNEGTFEGFFENIKYILDTFPETTIIAPGHSTLKPEPIETYNMAELREYYQLVLESVQFIREKFDEGITLEEFEKIGLPQKFKVLSEPYIYVSETRWIRIVNEHFNGHKN